MVEHVISAGPVHSYDEFESTPVDVEEPDLKINQTCSFEEAYRELVSFSGEWRWKVEFIILTNPSKREMLGLL